MPSAIDLDAAMWAFLLLRSGPQTSILGKWATQPERAQLTHDQSRSGTRGDDMKPVSRFVVSGWTARRFATAALASGVLVVASSGVVAAPSDDPATTATPMSAKWVPRKIHFQYNAVAPSSSTTYYSCDKLQAQITSILKQLGARNEVVEPFGCITIAGPEKFAGVDATFSALEPAGSGDQAASGSESVDAHWDKVTLNSGTSCELIKQVQERILPLFATRNQSSGCSPRFSLEVLRPVKQAAKS
jgi:hypothetical protein